MESLSRPFHSRKLSNATTFSAKSSYDGVFSGHRHSYGGASPIDVQDYREIFGSSSAASSIPVLDLSSLREPSDALNLNSNFRSSRPDYFKIFGRFRDEDVAVSYEELFAPDKTRSPSSKTSSSSDSDNLSHQSSDALKQFNMSYNKVSQKSKDGLDGTARHVTQLHAIPGFTRFIDEAVPPLMEAKKHDSSAVHDSSKRSKHHPGESFSEDKILKTFDNLEVHLSTVSPSSPSPMKVKNHKDYPMRSTAESCDSSEGAQGTFSPAYFDEEVDVNSAAVALKKAIEKAQESIRIAKESVGRKKKGLRSFSSKSLKDSLKVEGRMKDVTANEEQKCKDEVRQVFERATASSQLSSDMGRARKYSMDSEKLFVAKKFIDEIHGKISESTKDRLISVNSCNNIVTKSTQVMSETECRFLDSAGKDEYATLSSEAVGTEKSWIEPLDFVLADQTDNISVDDDEGSKIKATVVFNYTQVTGETVKVDKSRESKENKDEVRPSDAHELVKGLNNLTVSQKVEDDMKVPEESNQNEKQESHKQEETCDYSIQESKETAQDFDSSSEESEVILQDDCEVKQEDDHRGERNGESSDSFCDEELDEIFSGDDNASEETCSTDGLHVARNIVMDTHESFKVDMNDNNVETTQETDTGFVQIGNEENDVQSQSSSMEEEVEEEEEEEEEESNVQLHQEKIPEIESTNEIQEPLNKKEKTMEEMRTSKDREKENERVDEVAAREREREKDRLAVDRAIREARERARERAERAAVEKATEESRQRIMAEARERAEQAAAVEKATEEIRQRMRADAREKAAKASAQSKLRAERAAVERATSEARQRALEKAMTKKPLQDSRSSNGTTSESALRKAKFEKDNKIMERAAKALAEKEKRDLLAQKEQAERNRLAENLDADIKKWSNGKEGNLRALLSTLQYILGPESGWQPVSLTEIIASSAVKKAYRKATLCVHPDKLQQRGASIQHKYICEKVFDLLKAAWNKFNSEER